MRPVTPKRRRPLLLSSVSLSSSSSSSSVGTKSGHKGHTDRLFNFPHPKVEVTVEQCGTGACNIWQLGDLGLATHTFSLHQSPESGTFCVGTGFHSSHSTTDQKYIRCVQPSSPASQEPSDFCTMTLQTQPTFVLLVSLPVAWCVLWLTGVRLSSANKQ